MIPFNQYILRIPALPLHRLSDPDFSEQFYHNSFLNEALYVASPVLHQHMCQLAEGKIKEPKEIAKVKLALYRYWNRLCTRCTPFGLFAGCSTGKLHHSTYISVPIPGNRRAHYRLDMDCMLEFMAGLQRLPAVFNALKFYPNNSIYKLGEELRYAEFQLHQGARSYRLSKVASDRWLETLLAAAASGLTFSGLCGVIDDETFTQEEVRDFVMELIGAQLLVSELEPAVTGGAVLDETIRLLKNNELAPECCNELMVIQDILTNPQTGIQKYAAISNSLKRTGIKMDIKNLVQVDAAFEDGGTISKTVLEMIVQQLKQLWVLNYQDDRTGDLSVFKEKFLKRYQEEEVPLVQVLDAEFAIGYGDYTNQNSDNIPFIQGIPQGSFTSQKRVVWNKLEELILTKYLESQESNLAMVEITEKDLEQFPYQDRIAYPATNYVLGSILATDAIAMDSGRFQFHLLSCGVGSAANLISRFCYLDESIEKLTEEICQFEQEAEPEIIVAEIVHLPQSRVGNILMRPSFREFEIAYLGKSGKPPEQRIDISDLMVSVSNNEIILRSKKHNKRVLPKLTSSHNYSQNNLAVYKFLCDLQHQRINAGVYWDWGVLATRPHLPRVVFKNIILERERWVLRLQEFGNLNTSKHFDSFKESLQEIRGKRNIPSRFMIAEGDNEILVDMQSDAGLQQLQKELLQKKSLFLIECLQTETTVVSDGSGYYNNELLIPCYNPQYVSNRPTYKKANQPDVQRFFLPGSEWMFLKFYCGSSTSDTILKEVLFTMMQERPGFLRWHFVRYADPENHLRVRFYNKDPEQNTVLFRELMKNLKPLLDGGFIRKVQQDTYEREVERYGAVSMELAEWLFFIDSDAVIELLALPELENFENLRWHFGAMAVLDYLSIFRMDPVQKYEFMKSISDGFLQEFGNGTTLIDRLNNKYRLMMRDVRNMIEGVKLEQHTAAFHSILEKRKERMQSLFDTYGNIDELLPILPSYIHMLLNRLFLSNPRKQEMVLYYFLQKALQSQLAIQKKAYV